MPRVDWRHESVMSVGVCRGPELYPPKPTNFEPLGFFFSQPFRRWQRTQCRNEGAHNSEKTYKCILLMCIFPLARSKLSDNHVPMLCDQTSNLIGKIGVTKHMSTPHQTTGRILSRARRCDWRQHQHWTKCTRCWSQDSVVDTASKY